MFQEMNHWIIWSSLTDLAIDGPLRPEAVAFEDRAVRQGLRECNSLVTRTPAGSTKGVLIFGKMWHVLDCIGTDFASTN